MRNNDQIHSQRHCGKFKSGKTKELRSNTLYYERDYWTRRERASQPFCIYNGMHTFLLYLTLMTRHFLFIEKIRVTSYEIIKLPLTRVLEFHRLRSFQTKPLHCYASTRRCYALSFRSAPSSRCFGVLLQVDVSEYSSRVIPS